MSTVNLTITTDVDIDPEVLRNFYEFEEGTDISSLSDQELEALFLDVPHEQLLDSSERYNYQVALKRN